MRFLLISVCFLLQASSLVSLSVNQTIHSECVVLMNGKTGRILWQRKSDTLAFPASTTKIATVFTTFMQKPNGLKERVVAQREALITVSPSKKEKTTTPSALLTGEESNGSQVGHKIGRGDECGRSFVCHDARLRQRSSNVLAQHVAGGSIPKFMDDLNRFLKQLGCTKTRFTNPHGLHHPEHVTTARDLARLSQCAMYHPAFRKLAKSQIYERKATNKSPKGSYVQSNRLLGKAATFILMR